MDFQLVAGMDRVVPFAAEFVGLQIDMGELFICDPSPDGVLAVIQPAGHFQALGRRRSCDQPHHGLVIAQRITLDSLTRTYRTPRVLDEMVALPGYDGLLRQLTVIDLGHEEPTALVTNHLKRRAMPNGC